MCAQAQLFFSQARTEKIGSIKTRTLRAAKKKYFAGLQNYFLVVVRFEIVLLFQFLLWEGFFLFSCREGGF